MGKINDSQIREMFYGRNDSKEIIKEINKECLKTDSCNKAILKFIKGEVTFDELNMKEKTTVFNSIYNITKLSKYSYEKLFIPSETEECNIEDDDYFQKFMELDYMGISSDEFLSDEEKMKILKTYDKYQLSKLKMLNDSYPNKSTKITYFTIYQTNLHSAEELKGKDLMNFTTKEIEDLIETLLYAYDTTRQNLITFTNLYCEWAVEEKLIKKNPCSKLKRDKIKTNPKIFLSNKIYGKTKFYDMIELLEQKTKLPNIIPLILARYGIVGKNLNAMINLRWNDIDENSKIVYINNMQLPIDHKFIEYIHKAKAYIESPRTGGKNTVRYCDYGYVLKKAFNENNEKDEHETTKYATIFNRTNEASKSIGIARIPFKNLLLTRQFELLLEIRKYGRLKQEDFEYIVKIFNLGEDEPLVNRAFQLKKRWIELTGDLVITQRKNTKNLPNDNNYDIYEKLKQDLDLCL